MPKCLFYYYHMTDQSPSHPPIKPSGNLTNPSLKQLNESYASKIAKGEIQVTKQESKSKLSPAEQYDKLMKAKKLAQAEKQKRDLQKKLEYLNRSIQSIKDYDFSTGKTNTNEPTPPPQRVSPPKDMEQLRKKVKQYQNELNKKRQASRLRKEQREQQQKKILEKQVQAKKADKMQKIYENMQKIKKRIQERQSSTKKHEQEYRRVILQKSLHEKLQQSFTLKQASILEQRKKKLADIRNLHRPISLAEISDHEKTFMEVLKEKQSMRQRERRINNANQEYKVTYRSPTHMKLTQGENEPKEDQSRIKADKMRQFSQHVRENFVPLVDDRKREILQKVLQQEKERKQRQMSKNEQQAQRVQEIRNKGLRYLQQMRYLPKKRNASSGQSPPPSQRIHYKNYLTHSQRGSGRAWHSILSGSQDKKQKAIRLQAEAERMQDGLRLREKKARLLKEDPGEIDQEYFDMIKAKLDLLQI